MKQSKPKSGERIVKYFKRKARKRHSTEEKIRIVLDGMRGVESIAELCRQETAGWGYHPPSKNSEVKDLKTQARDLKKVVSEQTPELRLLKQSMFGPLGICTQLPVGNKWGRRTMRHPASEKLEVIQLVEVLHLNNVTRRPISNLAVYRPL